VFVQAVIGIVPGEHRREQLFTLGQVGVHTVDHRVGKMKRLGTMGADDVVGLDLILEAHTTVLA